MKGLVESMPIETSRGQIAISRERFSSFEAEGQISLRFCRYSLSMLIKVRLKVDRIIHLLETKRRHFRTCALRQHVAGYASQFLAQSYVGQLAGQTPPGVRSRDPTMFPSTG